MLSNDLRMIASLALLPCNSSPASGGARTPLCLQERPISCSDPRQLLETRQVRVRQWPNQLKPLTLVRVHAFDADTVASRSMPRRWAQTTPGVGGRSPTVRVDDPHAGEEAQVRPCRAAPLQ